MRYDVTLGGREVSIDVTPTPSGGWAVTRAGEKVDVDVVSTGASLSLRIDGQVFDVLLDGSAPQLAFALGRSLGAHGMARGTATVTSERARSRDRGRGARDGAAPGATISAPMPGRIVRVLVAANQAVSKGSTLVVMEAMKMENELRSPRDARVAAVLVAVGEAVERGAVLLTLE